MPGRPLLVVDGDSFAHRAYHGLPKTILGVGGKPAGAIVGFANFLLRMVDQERPRAVLVGWDTLDVPNYRHKAFPAYQGGRHFDKELLVQLDLLPLFVAACGFANAKAAGYEADDFLAAAVAHEERRGGTAVVASGDRDTFQLASASTVIVHPPEREMARIGPARCAIDTVSSPVRSPTSSHCGDPSDKLPGARASGWKGAAALLEKWDARGRADGGPEPSEADSRGSIAGLHHGRIRALPALRDQTPTWGRAATLARDWELNRLADRLDELDRSGS